MTSDTIQMYRVKQMTFDEGTFNFDGYNCQMVQLDKNSALFLVLNPYDPRDGLMDVFDFLAHSDTAADAMNVYNLKEIIYSISAFLETEPDVLHSQDFVHKFKSGTTMDSSWKLTTRRGTPMFTVMPLNTLLDTDKFPDVIGTQFVS